MTRRFLSLLILVLVAIALAPSNTVAAPLAISRPAPVMFIENTGQFASGARFLVRGTNATLYLSDDALWFTFLEKNTSTNPRAVSSKMRGVNLKVTFSGANAKPRLEPFNRLNTRITYLLGKDTAKWRTNVPAWGGVRYKDLYPGIDLEITGADGQLTPRLVAQAGAWLNNVQMRVEGTTQLALETNRVRASTALGDVRLPLVTINDPRADSLRPLIISNVIGFPFARGTTADARVNVRDQADLLFSSYLGGSSDDVGNAIAVDANGAVYVTGTSASSDFPTTTGAFQKTLAGASDVFVFKIDPAASQATYVTFIGGTGDDVGLALRVDTSGNAFVAGSTSSADFPTTTSAYKTTAPGGGDAFALKLAPDGASLAYATYLGGAARDVANSMALDADGNAYLTGETESSDFPVTNGATKQGTSDAFVTKLNANGNALTYSTLLSGANVEAGMAIAVDTTNAAYITGVTTSGNFTTTLSARDRRYDGGNVRFASDAPCGDAFIAKLVPDGSAYAYSTFLGGTGCDVGNAIAVDTNGNAFVSGTTSSTDFPTTQDAYQHTNAGGTDAFAIKLNANASVVIFSSLFGGAGNDSANGISFDADGNVYFAGTTASSNLPTSASAFQTTLRGTSDAFITKLNASATTLAYSSFFGGGTIESGNAFVLDANQRAWLVGTTDSTDLPTSGTTFQSALAGGRDAFITKLVLNTSTPTTYSILGRVTDATSNPLTDVSLTVAPNSSATLDANGFYTITNLITGTYTITPTKTNYTFAPSTRTVSVPPNASAQDFVGALITSTISGRITDGNGSPSSGVSVSDGAGHTATTNTNGEYVIPGLTANTYTLTPTKAGCTFSPTTLSVTVPPNATNKNFAIACATFSTIAGRVTDASSNPLADVVVRTTAGYSATTSATGVYTITGLPANTYNLSASKTGCTFSPDTLPVTVPPDATGKNLSGTCPPPTYTISGRVVDNLGASLANVSVNDGQGHAATTDASGTYTFTSLISGTYSITPAKTNYTFNPGSSSVSVPPSASAVNFVGTTTINRPPAPTSVIASDSTYATHVLVVWNNVPVATSYKIYRGTTNDPNAATQLATLNRIMRYEDRAATPGTSYWYWIVANNGVDSDFSTPDTGTRALNWQIENVNWRVDYSAAWTRIARITKPGATNIRVHFSTIVLANGDQLQTDTGDAWLGSLADITSRATTDSNTLTLTLRSNGTNTGYLVIDRVEFQGVAVSPATWIGDLIPQPITLPTPTLPYPFTK